MLFEDECTNDDNHSYYGRLSAIQPEVGVAYSMLDIHIQKIIDTRAEAFYKQLDDKLKQFRKGMKEDLIRTRKSLATAKIDIQSLYSKLNEKTKSEVYIRTLIKRLSDKVEEMKALNDPKPVGVVMQAYESEENEIELVKTLINKRKMTRVKKNEV